MDITVRVSEESGEMIIVANGTETPVASIEEALESIKALAEEAIAGAGMGSAEEIPVEDEMGEGVTPEQMDALEEKSMMQGFKGKGPRM